MVENLAEVVVDGLFILVQCDELVAGFATVNVEHALTQERIKRRVLVLGKDKLAVAFAGPVEIEFALDDVSAKVFDFEPVS